ncbi:hypothetical protein VKT23_010564 [Stygiomarasmius scandens]|uniref:RRM domain-containing protein n=1 Tax=Marasmiellus scandens TaxID=2682957 RepID=A0ABR1JGQ8_9AGAR
MAVTLTQASTTRKNKPGDQVARVNFPDVATAEKAMALLQFEILPTSNHSIGFCLKERSFPIKPRPAVSPRLFRYQTSGLTRSVIYDVLRLFGPIFLIRVKEQNTASVVFWKEEDADAAFQSLGQWRIDGESIGVQLWPVYPHDSQSSQAPNVIEAPTTVQDTHSTAPGPAKTEPVVYDSCRLFCNYLPPAMDNTGLRKLFEKFGHITSAEVYNKPRRGYAHGLVTFRNREDALHAVDALNGTLLGKKKILVRLDRPKDWTVDTRSTVSLEPRLKRIKLTFVHAKHQPEPVEFFDAPEEPDSSHIHPDQSFSQSYSILSLTESQVTLADSSFADSADIGASSKPAYSKVAAAAAPPWYIADTDNGQKPSSTGVVDESNLVSHLLAQTWKDEADRLRTELNDVRARESKLAEEWAKGLKERQKQMEEMVRDWEERKELMKQSEQLERENSRLAGQLDLMVESEKQEKVNADTTQKEIRRLHTEVALLRLREEELEGQVESEKVKVDTAAEEIMKLRSEAVSFGRREEGFEGKVVGLTRELEESKKLREKMASRNAELREKLEDLTRKSEESKKLQEKMASRNAELGERLGCLTRKSEESKKLQEKMADKNAELEGKVEDLTRKLEETKKLQEKIESENAELGKQLKLSESRRKVLELEADRPRWEEAKRKREEAEREEREKELQRKRQKELEEKRRRMQEMEQEERAAEEKRRLEEERRKAEEERNRPELEEKLKREKAWKRATAAENRRCHDRDQNTWGAWKWSNSLALSRFKLVMEEFEKAKFSPQAPMTVLSIPWPVLDSPFSFSVRNVQWDAVERFFRTIRPMVGLSEYKALLERSHKAFHPDRWRSRNLLSSVMEEEQRRLFERAGNIVSQALTPIWRNSKE